MTLTGTGACLNWGGLLKRPTCLLQGDTMLRRRHDRRPARRSINRERAVNFESLEGRIVLAAAIGYDRASRTVSIVGSEGNDSAQVRQQGANLVVSLNSAAGRFSRTVPAAQVSRVVFTGLAGNDTFTNQTGIASRADGGAGADILRGGRGVDQLRGGDDNDQLFGGEGNDTLDGGTGNDAAWGGVGNDRLMGGVGQDQVYGEGGTDDMWGGAGNDMLDGGAGNDTIRGEDGSDDLRGGAGSDWLGGFAGGDMLTGGIGNDTLEGGQGSDTLDGQEGSDRLVGGVGIDREMDLQDRFGDGDSNGDGFDDEWDSLDLFDQSALFGWPDRDDPAVAESIRSVDASLREMLGIQAADPGLQILAQSSVFEGRSVAWGLWRYRTADGMAVRSQWYLSDSQLGFYDGFPVTLVGDAAPPQNNVTATADDRFGTTLPVEITWNRDETVAFGITFYGDTSAGFIDRVRSELGFAKGLTFTAVTNSLGNQDLRVEGQFSGTTGLPPLSRILEIVRAVGRISSGSAIVNPSPLVG